MILKVLFGNILVPHYTVLANIVSSLYRIFVFVTLLSIEISQFVRETLKRAIQI